MERPSCERKYQINSDIYSKMNKKQLINLFKDRILNCCILIIYKNLNTNDIDRRAGDIRFIKKYTQNMNDKINTYIEFIRAMTIDEIEIENILEDEEYIIYKTCKKIINNEYIENNILETIRKCNKILSEKN